MRTNGPVSELCTSILSSGQRLLNGHVSDDGWPSVIMTELFNTGLSLTDTALHKSLCTCTCTVQSASETKIHCDIKYISFSTGIMS